MPTRPVPYLSREGIFGVAPGQSAVFYGPGDDDRVLCDGTILRDRAD